jgi:prepilin-type N-terminal cleavage/methylation domain-containing protein
MSANTRRSGKAPSAEGGFTLVELLIVVAIIGILASIAIPAMKYQLLKTRAQRIVGDLRVAESAAMEYYVDNSKWPADTQPGAEPSGLKDYLRGKVNWNNTKWGYQLDWDMWYTAQGTPIYPTTGVGIGIAVTTTDKNLVAMMTKVAPKPFKWTLNNNYEYVIEIVKTK